MWVGEVAAPFYLWEWGFEGFQERRRCFFPRAFVKTANQNTSFVVRNAISRMHLFNSLCHWSKDAMRTHSNRPINKLFVLWRDSGFTTPTPVPTPPTPRCPFISPSALLFVWWSCSRWRRMPWIEAGLTNWRDFWWSNLWVVGSYKDFLNVSPQAKMKHY